MNNQDTINKFEKIIINAFNSVPQDYYKLKTACSSEGIVRERVFCYELYHRIRCLQKIEQLPDFNIHGEIDKRGYALFDKDDWRNPDFVFHKPGSMDENLIVIEVKGNLDHGGVIKDWQTLYKFCDTYHYGVGLWLVYNYTYTEIVKELSKIEQRFEEKTADQIKLICKKSADSKLDIISFSELFSDVLVKMK
ncbi:MAG TPA: hypothetical protein PKD52_04395 [Clostridiales bacterium]|nr:hypothetical protein [Clostridiales bacterium]